MGCLIFLVFFFLLYMVMQLDDMGAPFPIVLALMLMIIFLGACYISLPDVLDARDKAAKKEDAENDSGHLKSDGNNETGDMTDKNVKTATNGSVEAKETSTDKPSRSTEELIDEIDRLLKNPVRISVPEQVSSDAKDSSTDKPSRSREELIDEIDRLLKNPVRISVPEQVSSDAKDSSTDNSSCSIDEIIKEMDRISRDLGFDGPGLDEDLDWDEDEENEDDDLFDFGGRSSSLVNSHDMAPGDDYLMDIGVVDVDDYD